MAPAKKTTTKSTKSDSSKFKLENGGSVSFDYAAHAVNENRKNVTVNGVSVGYLVDDDGKFSAYIDPAQEGAGMGVAREVVSGASEKEANQALADALGKHADHNALSA